MRVNSYKKSVLLVLFALSAIKISFGQPPLTVRNWQSVIEDATQKPDTTKVEVLSGMAGLAIANYMAGREKGDLSIAQTLISKTGELSNVLHYQNGFNQSLLLKSRLYYMLGKDSIASALGNQAMTFYRKADLYYLSEALYFLSQSWRFRTHQKEINPSDSTYYMKATDYYRQTGKKLQEASLRRVDGYIHVVTGNNLKAIDELLNLYIFQVKINDSSRHKTTDLLAHVYAVTGQFKDALDYAFQSLKYANSVNDSSNLGTYYYRIGRIKYNLHELSEGTRYLKKSSYYFELQRDTPSAAHVILVTANEGLRATGQNKEALQTVQDLTKRFPIWSMDNHYLQQDVAATLADCYLGTKQYALAEKYYLYGLRIVEANQNTPEMKIPICFGLSMVYLEQQKTDLAVNYFNRTLTYAEQTNSLPAIRDVQLQLFKIDSAKGNFTPAIKHYQLYQAVNDSMFNQARSNQISELEVQFNTQQKERDLQFLGKENEIQKVTIRQNAFVKNVVIAGAILLLLLLFVLFNRYQLKQRANRELQEKQEKINLQNQSLEKLVRDEQILVAEKDKLLHEKEWLIKEIHHRVKNNLQIVMSLLNSQSAYLEDETSREAIRESQHRVHTISLIHQKLYQSENLSAISMDVYIREVVEYLGDNLDLHHRVRFELGIEPIELGAVQAVPLGLIINEAITNAVKYAFPQNNRGTINITMHHFSEKVTLTIRDNGTGFPENFDWHQTQSLGISLMKGLSKQINGDFEIINDKGLTVRLSFIPDKIF